jgi:probable rRNA maturation factor
MILIKNQQRKIAIDLKKLETDAQQILVALKYLDFDLGILITTNATIQKYNRDYRHKDKPTDILSFPAHPDLQAGKRIKVHSDDDKNLGDLIISAQYVVKAAHELQVPFEERLEVLLVHGICHLLGYDHITDADWRRMRAKEAFLLKKLRNKL